MKKQILTLTTILLAVAMLATPVMAEPTKGLKVSVSFTVIPPPTSTPGDLRWTPSGVAHGKGLVEVYSGILIIDGTPYPASFVSVYQLATWNPQQETMITHTKDILYIPSEGSYDGFSGMGANKFYGWSWSTFTWTSQRINHVWHGFGSFEGQTLMLSYEGPISPTTTGYCLKG